VFFSWRKLARTIRSQLTPIDTPNDARKIHEVLILVRFTPLESPAPWGGWDEYNPPPFLERAVGPVRDFVSNGIGSKAPPFLTGFTTNYNDLTHSIYTYFKFSRDS
jgi:hypothetical protein